MITAFYVLAFVWCFCLGCFSLWVCLVAQSDRKDTTDDLDRFDRRLHAMQGDIERLWRYQRRSGTDMKAASDGPKLSVLYNEI